MRKILVAGFIEIAVFAMVLWWHMAIHWRVWVLSGARPEMWKWTEALFSPMLLFAVAQYMLVCSVFIAAWLLWRRCGHKVSYILSAWGITWIPLAYVATCDCEAMAPAAMSMPVSYFAFPFFVLFCIAETLLIALCVKPTVHSR